MIRKVHDAELPTAETPAKSSGDAEDAATALLVLLRTFIEQLRTGQIDKATQARFTTLAAAFHQKLESQLK